MALQIDFTDTTQQDYPTAYFKVIELLLNYLSGSAIILVLGFKNKAASDAVATPVTQKRYEITGATFTSTFGIANLQKVDPIAAAYTYLLTLPDFQGATVV